MFERTTDGTWRSRACPFVSPLHVGVHGGKVVLHHVVRGAVGDGAEPEGWLRGLGIGESVILQTAEIRKLLSSNHEGG